MKTLFIFVFIFSVYSCGKSDSFVSKKGTTSTAPKSNSSNPGVNTTGDPVNPTLPPIGVNPISPGVPINPVNPAPPELTLQSCFTGCYNNYNTCVLNNPNLRFQCSNILGDCYSDCNKNHQ